ncbi:flagellin N-terminal helical domain-containing protein [Glacieibacterium frigidum]|uniref:Flagellin n=1 Tax=Glacieibacterium frigidum TaxID=2593303 RepID=A0A552UEM0_9SPHN|nr:flagellin [Glacieibacterium frigidum]TRW16678.1 hypothetical protein FMM06_00205 [Glacieibacterium frigidum]
MNTRASHDARVARMGDLQRQLDTEQGRIATGKRITKPSDDPVANGIAARLKRVAAAGETQLRALDGAASRLSATDVALGSAARVMQRAQEVALLGSTATLNAADRATLAAEAVSLGEQLLEIANRTAADGTPLFGGAKGTGPAFARDAAGDVAWQGTGTPPVIALGSATVPTGTDARAFAGPDGDAFALLDDLAAALTAPDATRADALSASLTGLTVATTRIADAQAGIGNLGARVEAETERLRSDGLRLADDLSKVEGLDLAAAIARLQRLATVLEATQASFVRLNALSLWERL